MAKEHEDAITRLTQAIKDVNEGVPSMVALIDGDPEGLALLLDALREQRKLLAGVEAAVESFVVKAAEARRVSEFEMSDGRIVKIHGGTDRKNWDRPRVFSVAVARVTAPYKAPLPVGPDAVAPSPDGEFIPLAELLDRVAREVAATVEAIAPSGDLRVTPMKRLGMTPNDYCDTEKGRRTVQIVGTTE